VPRSRSKSAELRISELLLSVFGQTKLPLVMDNTIQFLSRWWAHFESLRDTVNEVPWEYLHGTPKSPEEVGFIHCAYIPPGWEEFGFPERAPSGKHSFFNRDKQAV
jgi:hypothetical protein